MAGIALRHVSVTFPMFFAGDRSFKRNLFGPLLGPQSSRHRNTVIALDDVTLALQGGSRLAVLGGNAAGKTTLLRVLGGLLPPSKGSAETHGRAISLLGTGIGIDANFTAHQTIIGQGLLLGFGAAACRQRLERAVDFGALEGVLDQPLNTLSQGDQVRLALGIAVAYEAEILLIDEMLDHLQPAMIDRLCKHIESGMPPSSIVVIAERSKAFLERICDQAVLLNHGKLLDSGPLAGMLERHQTQLTS
ncbi:ABC transporter ATP-binding protein [Ferrovibrio sp.]|uniref:ABC transporter ATP-binding protein n=1 Tax=Ferrovibrio sp. TaxID=1917215 RepID=UPI0025BF3184|nr:ATP-binding cassette domain-containing protein [Ferrovibrio sp.]MBX3453436.1 ABC transporter ATP-binding protein [Ferrovibrio sp.]